MEKNNEQNINELRKDKVIHCFLRMLTLVISISMCILLLLVVYTALKLTIGKFDLSNIYKYIFNDDTNIVLFFIASLGFLIVVVTIVGFISAIVAIWITRLVKKVVIKRTIINIIEFLASIPTIFYTVSIFIVLETILKNNENLHNLGDVQIRQLIIFFIALLLALLPNITYIYIRNIEKCSQNEECIGLILGLKNDDRNFLSLTTCARKNILKNIANFITKLIIEFALIVLIFNTIVVNRITYFSNKGSAIGYITLIIKDYWYMLIFILFAFIIIMYRTVKVIVSRKVVNHESV